MGSCVSSHHKELSLGSKVQQDSSISFNYGDIPMKCSPCSLQESADETFFDTQVWFESDCEEDFQSANGDFIPSRGNTPVRMGVPLQSKRGEWAQDLKQEEPLPHMKRKTLSDLFEESVSDQNVKYFLSRANTVHSCERTPPSYRELKTGKEKSVRSLQCCFTGLSYVEGKKNSTSSVP